MVVFFFFSGGNRIGRLCSTKGIGGVEPGGSSLEVVLLRWDFTYLWSTLRFLTLICLVNHLGAILRLPHIIFSRNTPKSSAAVFPIGATRESRKTRVGKFCFNFLIQWYSDTLPPRIIYFSDTWPYYHLRRSTSGGNMDHGIADCLFFSSLEKHHGKLLDPFSPSQTKLLSHISLSEKPFQ